MGGGEGSGGGGEAGWRRGVGWMDGGVRRRGGCGIYSMGILAARHCGQGRVLRWGLGLMLVSCLLPGMENVVCYLDVDRYICPFVRVIELRLHFGFRLLQFLICDHVVRLLVSVMLTHLVP